MASPMCHRCRIAALQVIETEARVGNVLGWRLHCPTPRWFLESFLLGAYRLRRATSLKCPGSQSSVLEP